MAGVGAPDDQGPGGLPSGALDATLAVDGAPTPAGAPEGGRQGRSDAGQGGASWASGVGATMLDVDGASTGCAGPRGGAALVVEAARYRVGALLGAGGMGEVFLAEDDLLGREVAVKRLRGELASSQVARARFLREARTQGRVEHPSVVPVHDLVVGPDGATFFIMRRIRGRSLHEVIEGLARGDTDAAARHPRRRLLTAFASVCLAVHYAHSCGVVHRDLKPGNVMLGDFGEVYVLDWGLAREVTALAGGDGLEGGAHEAFGPPDHRAGAAQGVSPSRPGVSSASSREGAGQATAAGVVLGTPGYMSPEQARGHVGSLDARSDVYALGALLFELLTLQRMHRGDTVADLVASTLEGRVDLPSARAADVPPELDAICARATALAPHDRFATARDLGEAVERYLDGDRDLERRRELAAQHFARAEAAFARTLAPVGPYAPPDAIAAGAAPAALTADATQAARQGAMNELVRALAFDPEHASARALLARLFVESPDHLPPEAEAALKRRVTEVRLDAMRKGWVLYGSWLICVPYVLFMGVRSWPMVLLSIGAVVACAAVAGVAVARRASGPRALLTVAAVTLAATATFACWLGPFVLVPIASTCLAMLFVTVGQERERPVVLLLAALAVLVPFALDLSGLVEPGFFVRDGALVLPARAIEISSKRTIPALVYVCLAFSVAPAWYVGKVHDRLRSAERRLFLQAWQLEQVARGEAASAERRSG